MTGMTGCGVPSGRLKLTILGSLSATIDGRSVAIGGPRQRTILAMLTLAWGQVVSVDSLVDAVWGERPPNTARTQVAICIGGLRKAFSAAGLDDTFILTVHPGYRLVTDLGRLDASDFTRLVKEASHHTKRGNLLEASKLYKEALDVWRGPALAGVVGQPIADEATRLEEQRLVAYEAWTKVELALGRHHELIPGLSAMVRDNPLHEQLRYSLMLAQYRAGRRVEAAEGYRLWRRAFVDELGLEPSPAIQQLHQAILRDDPTLALPGGGRPAELRVVPAELPSEMADFTGREAELAALDQLLDLSADGSPPMTTGFVTGVAGGGKTSLAVHWAHRVAKEFPDGQLYADFSDYDWKEESGTVHALLGRFLRALGTPAEQIPEDLADRMSLYRSVLADRRVLVVLDNVRVPAQVTQLLPGSGRCRVLVTSREQPSHPTVGPGTLRIDLGLLPARQAVELIGSIAGPDRIAADPAAVDELCRLCDGLPLALRIAAARLASKPHWSVRHLVHRLSDERHRLDELSTGGIEVRASFALSYHSLPEDAARMYRRLGLLDVPDFTAWVGGTLLDVGSAEAEDLMEQLVDAHLLTVVGSDATGRLRYRFHDLLRLYARERANSEEPETELNAARDRALRTWLTLAEEAHRREYGGDFAIIHGTTPRRPLEQRLTDELLATPLSWLESERLNIAALIVQACQLGRDELAWDLMMSSVVLFETRNHYEDWRLLSETCLQATRRAGNIRGEAAMCFELGSVDMFQRRFDQAMPLFATALRLFGDIGELHGRALTLRNMAIADRVRGDLVSSASRLAEARETFRAVGDSSSEAHALSQLAQIELDRERPDAAVRLSLQAVRIATGAGETRGMAQTLYRLAASYAQLGRFGAAEETYQRVLRTVRAKGDAPGEAHALLGIGELRIAAGRLAEAETAILESMPIAQRIGDRLLVARIGLGLGRCYQGLNRPDQAHEYLTAARDLFRELGSVTGERQAEAEIAALVIGWSVL
ncbi:BTAD domain-containing putative transcriptional regulator [Streptomyces sp. NPDC001851]|uniref:AfsR/SARP family transcriptional regulator n=1 Tax=Streptomyces sp. NPDC001851 TaxID=3154529 RepID=UPI003327B239